MKTRVTEFLEMKNVNGVIKDFIFHCKYEKNLNFKTINAYQIDLNQFNDHLLAMGIENINQISKLDIKSYLRQISIFKPKTMKRKIASVKALFNYYEFEHDDFINPIRKMNINIKEPFKLPIVMTVNDVNRILEYLYHERSLNNYVDGYTYKVQTRDIVVIELLFATGMRVSELCQLECGDVDLSQGVIKVFGKGSKERMIQICSRDVLSILKVYKRLFQPESYFLVNRLGHKLSTQSVRIMVKKCICKCGLSKQITPHTFRHTFATLLLEEDVDIRYIQNLLGHSSISTTQIYTHVSSGKLKKILIAKHPRQKIVLNELVLMEEYVKKR